MKKETDQRGSADGLELVTTVTFHRYDEALAINKKRFSGRPQPVGTVLSMLIVTIYIAGGISRRCANSQSNRPSRSKMAAPKTEYLFHLLPFQGFMRQQLVRQCGNGRPDILAVEKLKQLGDRLFQ